jgi:hypothetical protein
MEIDNVKETHRKRRNCSTGFVWRFELCGLCTNGGNNLKGGMLAFGRKDYHFSNFRYVCFSEKLFSRINDK